MRRFQLLTLYAILVVLILASCIVAASLIRLAGADVQ
jgi:hypothetical protein